MSKRCRFSLGFSKSILFVVLCAVAISAPGVAFAQGADAAGDPLMVWVLFAILMAAGASVTVFALRKSGCES